jgi:DNA-binding CsgD family transcriptional regulator
MTIAGKPIPEGGYIAALQNGKKIALTQRRHRVIQEKIKGRSEAEIAEQERVAQYTIWKDIRAYLGEVR